MFSDLPVPKRKFSWLITVVLLVVSFYLYYGFFYQKFVDVYSDGIYQSSEFESDNFNGSVMLPKSISAFVARPVRVQIINDLKGEKSQTIEDLTVSVYSEPVEKNVQRISSLMFDPKKYVLENSYVIDQFQPYEIVEFEIPIQAKADQKIVIYATFPEKDNNNSDILTYQTELLSFSAPNLSYKPVQTYVQVAIEYLLMPPISNGLLPVLVAFVVYSMEYRRKEEDELKDIKKSYTKDINQGVATFIFSSILLGAFYCILSVVFDVTEDLSKVVVRYSDWGARWPWMIFCGILICYFVYWIYHARITVGILIEDGWPVEQEFQVKNRIALGSYFCIIGFFCTTFYLGMKLGKELLGLDFWVSVLLMLVWLLVFIFSSFRKILNWSVTNRNCAKLYSAINILLFFYGIFVLINMKILGWHLLLIFLVVILRYGPKYLLDKGMGTDAANDWACSGDVEVNSDEDREAEEGKRSDDTDVKSVAAAPAEEQMLGAEDSIIEATDEESVQPEISPTVEAPYSGGVDNDVVENDNAETGKAENKKPNTGED